MSDINARLWHFIGVDPSLRSTGVAIWSIQKDNISQYATTIKTPKNMTGTERLCHIRGELVRIINGHCTGGIGGLCIEEAAHKSVGRQIDLAEIRGVIKVTTVSLGVNPLGVAPKRLKKFGAGHGEASKEKMIKAATTAGWNVNNDDEADAAHLAFLAYAVATKESIITLKRKQLEVLADLGITL